MKTIVQKAINDEYNKAIKEKPNFTKTERASLSKLRALYREVGMYAYAKQFQFAKEQTEIKKRWEVSKGRLLILYQEALQKSHGWICFDKYLNDLKK